ncbi:SDR family oxidoreductase, partial [Fastidiosibacter lacustris]|uniref:SDR family oxidoreductase n=1 Tax=Fastidiosibacter lacustris TaxID=2056695 RepID=UPI000E34098F
IEKVGIDDDFFTLGGNSIKAIQLAVTLQANFDIAVSEIFDLRTPRKLAYNKRITHDLLIAKLAQIKQYYTQHHNKPLNSAALLKKEQYLAEVAHMPIIHYTNKSIKTVLLTGATGFLGCNLLHQLLTLTSYQIYLCVRAKDEVHARERMAHKYQFYFDVSLQDHFSDRIIYIACDLEKEQIGLADSEYHKLIKNIDSIIHCAALAKHYGIEQVFYSANVQATIHLLQFCQLTKHKD